MEVTVLAVEFNLKCISATNPQICLPLIKSTSFNNYFGKKRYLDLNIPAFRGVYSCNFYVQYRKKRDWVGLLVLKSVGR